MAETGLSQRVEEGDYGGLVEVMGHLLAVKERQHTTDSMFEPLQQTITLLKVYEQELPDVVYKQLEVKTDAQSRQILFTSTYSFFSSFQLRQSHYFFFVSSNCPSLFCSLAPGNSSSVTPACLAFLSFSPSPYLYISIRLPPQELPEKWNNVRKQAVLVKQQVAPLQAIEVASLRRKCASFDVEQHTFREHFRNNGPFRYNKYQLFLGLLGYTPVYRFSAVYTQTINGL